MGIGYTSTDGKAETRPFWLGGEEWLEDTGSEWFGDTGSCV